MERPFLPIQDGLTIVDESDETPYRFSPSEAAAIHEGDAEIERGEYVTATQLLAELKRSRLT